MPYCFGWLKGFRNFRRIFSYYLTAKRYFVFVVKISKWFLKFIDPNFRSDSQVIFFSKFYSMCLDRQEKITNLKHSVSFRSWDFKFCTARIISNVPLQYVACVFWNIIIQFWIPYIVEENFYQVAIISYPRWKLVTPNHSKLEYAFLLLQISRNETVNERALHVLKA